MPVMAEIDCRPLPACAVSPIGSLMPVPPSRHGRHAYDPSRCSVRDYPDREQSQLLP